MILVNLNADTYKVLDAWFLVSGLQWKCSGLQWKSSLSQSWNPPPIKGNDVNGRENHILWYYCCNISKSPLTALIEIQDFELISAEIMQNLIIVKTKILQILKSTISNVVLTWSRYKSWSHRCVRSIELPSFAATMTRPNFPGRVILEALKSLKLVGKKCSKVARSCLASPSVGEKRYSGS